MTRKDYILITEAIRPIKDKVKDLTPRMVYMAIVMSMIESLAGENPRFDHYKFLKACGLENN